MVLYGVAGRLSCVLIHRKTGRELTAYDMPAFARGLKHHIMNVWFAWTGGR